MNQETTTSSEQYYIFWLHLEKCDNFESYNYKIDVAQAGIIQSIKLNKH